MKILVIHGSMRRGSTYDLTAQIIRRLAEKPEVEITEISTRELELPFCTSCHICFLKGEEYCPHYSAMQGVESALLACDGVIVSGTTYVWALNAAMKNVLDHLAFMFHRPALFGKKGMVVSTSAGSGERKVAKYLKTVIGQWGINGALVLTLNTKEREMRSADKLSARLDGAAERFYQMIKSGKPLAPGMKNIAVHNAFRAMSLGEFVASERDTRHWQQNGFCDRAYPVYAGVVKYFAGAMVYVAVKNIGAGLGRVYKKGK